MLVVVARAVGFSWLILTATIATAVDTIELLNHWYHVFIPHGVPISLVSNADPCFTSQFWKQSLKTLGIEHIMAASGHHQTNGQAEHKIREKKTALRNVTNCRQSNWLVSLPSVVAYTNAGYSNTLALSPYKAVYGWDYFLLDTYKTKPSAVPAADNYYNSYQEVRNAAYQVLKLAGFRSTRTAAKWSNPQPSVAVGTHIMVFDDQFATESGHSRTLQPRWQDLFTVLEYDDHIQNYNIRIDT